MRLSAGKADVLALKRSGGRQHDVRHARGRVPELLVNDNSLRLLPRAAQPIEVLMVMEGITASPVNKPDIGKGEPVPVVLIFGSRIKQHIGDARDGDELPYVVRALRQGRSVEA